MGSISTPPGAQTPRESALFPGTPYTNPELTQLLSKLKMLGNDHQSLVKLPHPSAQEQTSIVDSCPQRARGAHDTAPAQDPWLIAFLCRCFEFLLGFVMFRTCEGNNSERSDSAESELPLGMNMSVGHDNTDSGNMEDCGNITHDNYTDPEDGGDCAEEGDFPEPGLLFGMKASVGNHNKSSGNFKGCGNVTRNRRRGAKPKSGLARKN
ncbi:hypothetical protein HOY82DRAFT_597776 [Tuber indicum]|nr:hypothetical protein HOY82DRAFT_597776 [Tuber indicum]